MLQLTWSKCSNRPPAAVSPSSSQSWTSARFLVSIILKNNSFLNSLSLLLYIHFTCMPRYCVLLKQSSYWFSSTPSLLRPAKKKHVFFLLSDMSLFQKQNSLCCFTSFVVCTIAACAWNVLLRSVIGSPWIHSGGSKYTTVCLLFSLAPLIGTWLLVGVCWGGKVGATLMEVPCCEACVWEIVSCEMKSSSKKKKRRTNLISLV